MERRTREEERLSVKMQWNSGRGMGFICSSLLCTPPLNPHSVIISPPAYFSSIL